MNRPSSRSIRWARFGLGLLGIWVFIFVVAPWIECWGVVGDVHQFVQARDINAAALFYTEIDEFREAEVMVRASLNPGKAP